MREFDWKLSCSEETPKKWVSTTTKQFGIGQTAAGILFRRGVRTTDQINKYLHGKYEHMYNPYLFKDMLKAVTRILRAKKKKEKVFVHGDYDCDGIMSASLIAMMLENLGLKNAEIFIPSRSLGYGLSNDAVKKAIKMKWYYYE